MIYWLILFLTLLIFVLYPLSLRIMGFLDVKNNRLFYSLICLKAIKIQSGYLTLKKGKVYAQTTKNEFKHIDFDEIKNAPIKIDSKVLKFLKVKKLNFFIEVGGGDSIFVKVFSTVPVNIATDFFANYLRKSYKNISINRYLIYKDDKVDFQLSIDGIAKISIANLTYLIIVGYLKKLKEKINGRNKNTKKQNRRSFKHSSQQN